METLIAPTVNLAILLGILFYYLREPLKTFIQQRHVSVREELVNVREMLHKAQERYDEFSAKLKAIDVEIKTLHDQAKQEAQSSKTRVLADAQKLASHIVADSRMAAQALYGDLKTQLSTELGNRVLERAESLVRERITAEDRARIKKEFSNVVETVK